MPATVMQEVNSWRLRVLGESAASTSYDARSAFHSIFHEAFAAFLHKHARQCDVELLISRHRRAVITARDGATFIDYSFMYGALLGDTIAAHMFRAVYQDVVDRWMEELERVVGVIVCL